MIQRFRHFSWICSLPLCLSCNVYSPFQPKSSDIDYLEDALKCLHKGDVACAIGDYENISESDVKNQKLCTGHLVASGFTLNAFINVITKVDARMLGDLAQVLSPWDTERMSHADSAKSACTAFASGGATTNLRTLLKVISLIVHCSTLMAKSDILAATSDEGACTSAGNRDGHISGSDITPQSDGSITSRGMCKDDVITCRDDLIDPVFNQLEQAGLTNLKGAYDKIPDNIRNHDAATNAIRAALKTTVSPD